MTVKSFKNIFIFGIAVLFIVCVLIIYEAPLSRTADFSGKVHCVKISEESGIAILHAEATFGGDFLFRIEKNSRLENLDGKEITISDIKPDMLIQIDYKKYILRDEEIQTVKKLKAII